jgi:hypothetical protein
MKVLFTPAQYLLSLEDLPPDFIDKKVTVLRKIGKLAKTTQYGLVLISFLMEYPCE